MLDYSPVHQTRQTRAELLALEVLGRRTHPSMARKTEAARCLLFL